MLKNEIKFRSSYRRVWNKWLVHNVRVGDKAFLAIELMMSEIKWENLWISESQLYNNHSIALLAKVIPEADSTLWRRVF